MSYINGLFLLSPKLASMEDVDDNSVTAGKRCSIDGLIGIFPSLKYE
jgi:hypothetical protein